MNVTLFGKRVFSDVIKDLEVRSSWMVTWVGPFKSNDYCPRKRQKRRQEKRRRHVKKRQRLE